MKPPTVDRQIADGRAVNDVVGSGLGRIDQRRRHLDSLARGFDTQSDVDADRAPHADDDPEDRCLRESRTARPHGIRTRIEAADLESPGFVRFSRAFNAGHVADAADLSPRHHGPGRIDDGSEDAALVSVGLGSQRTRADRQGKRQVENACLSVPAPVRDTGGHRSSAACQTVEGSGNSVPARRCQPRRLDGTPLGQPQPAHDVPIDRFDRVPRVYPQQHVSLFEQIEQGTGLLVVLV